MADIRNCEATASNVAVRIMNINAPVHKLNLQHNTLVSNFNIDSMVDFGDICLIRMDF